MDHDKPVRGDMQSMGSVDLIHPKHPDPPKIISRWMKPFLIQGNFLAISYLLLCLLLTILTIKSRLYPCPRYKKNVKSTSGLKRYVNVCRIPIILLSHQPSNPKPILDYNIINLLNLPSDNNKEYISLEASNNGEEDIRPADIDNNEKDIWLADIDKKRLATLN